VFDRKKQVEIVKVEMISKSLLSGTSIFDSVPTSPMNTTQEPQRDTEKFHWIFSMSFTAMLIALTLWVFISLIHYGIRTKLRKKRQKNKYVLNSGKIYTCVVVLSFNCLFLFISSLVTLNVGYSEKKN